MATRRILVCLGIATAFCGTFAVQALGKEMEFRAKYSGSGMSAFPDPNHDGIKSGTGILGCLSNLGRCTAQGVGEAVYAGAATCPNGNPGLRLELIPGTGHGFTRFEKGDLLFNELVTETVCYDPSLRMHFKSGTGKYTGGTGRFAGATATTSSKGRSGCSISTPRPTGLPRRKGASPGPSFFPTSSRNAGSAHGGKHPHGPSM
jgi:hypothetical protein